MESHPKIKVTRNDCPVLAHDEDPESIQNRKGGGEMTIDEQEKMAALESLIDMTGEDDWYLFHDTVRDEASNGLVSPEFETTYKEMIDRKANERGAIYE